MILIGDIVAEMAERLFDAATVERVKAAEFEADIPTGGLQHLEDMGGLVGGDVKLPAELTDIGDAVGAGEPHANLDLARRAEGMRLIGEIVRAHLSHQLARIRPHHTEHALGSGHIGNHHELGPNMLAQPSEVTLQRRA